MTTLLVATKAPLPGTMACDKRGQESMQEVLIIGTENSGKSTLVRNLKQWWANRSIHETSEVVTATIGTDITDVTVPVSEGNSTALSLTLRELGSAISAKWSSYYDDAKLIIFLADAADVGTWPLSTVLLHESLQQLTFSAVPRVDTSSPQTNSSNFQRNEKPFLLLLTKCDVTDGLSVRVFEEQLRVSEILERSAAVQSSKVPRVAVQSGSCLDVELVSVVAKWIVDNLSS